MKIIYRLIYLMLCLFGGMMIIVLLISDHLIWAFTGNRKHWKVVDKYFDEVSGWKKSTGI